MTGGRGRPPIPEEVRRSRLLRLRCTVAELDAYRHAAERAGVTLSEWTRVTLGAACDAGAASPSEFSQD